MKISIAICTHNEFNYLGDLLARLTTFIGSAHVYTPDRWEIVIVDDLSNDTTLDILTRYVTTFPDNIRWFTHALNNDFATHKNYMNSLCTGDWILNLDADEFLKNDVLHALPSIIETNHLVDAYWFPRINTVHGLTLKHVQKWRWTLSTLPGKSAAEMLDKTSDFYQLLVAHDLIVSETDGVVVYNEPIICWPDPQMRLYRNSPTIKWIGKVHERLEGFDNFTALPFEPEYAIHHYKDIERQAAQNNFYETL